MIRRLLARLMGCTPRQIRARRDRTRQWDDDGDPYREQHVDPD